MYFRVQVRQPECNAQTPVSCDASGTAIQYCQNNFFAYYACDGGCSNGACANPSGDVCFDSVSLDSATSPISGDWSGNTDAVNTGAGVVGACVWDSFDEPDGADNIYSVTLAQGDVLDVTVTTDEADTQVYVVTDCTDAPNSCVDYHPEEDDASVDRTITYQAQVSGTHYVVVDRADGANSGTYTLDWSVQTGLVCAPGQYQCLDPQTIGRCGANGFQYAASSACPTGCADNRCTVDSTWDTCPMAPKVGAGTIALAEFDTFTDDVNLPSSSCVGADTPGQEYFFSVDLVANETLDVTAYSQTGDTPSVYIFTDCANVNGTCVAGDEGTTSVPATASYTASMAETVYVGVDSSSSFDSEAFFVEVDKILPDCMPGQYTNICTPDGLSIQYCDAQGFFQTYTCTDANMDGTACVNGACDEPMGDDCFEPIEAVPGMSGILTLTGDFADFTDDVNLPSTGCTGDVTPGRTRSTPSI